MNQLKFKQPMRLPYWTDLKIRQRGGPGPEPLGAPSCRGQEEEEASKGGRGVAGEERMMFWKPQAEGQVRRGLKMNR